MTDQELKKLKDNLWHSADMLRASAHLSVSKYGQTILRLISCAVPIYFLSSTRQKSTRSSINKDTQWKNPIGDM